MNKIEAGAVEVAVGGVNNIVEITPCISRVRIVLGDASLADRGLLKELGALGVVVHANIVQIVVGPEADILADELSALMKKKKQAR
ncbi:MAG: PTS transporter subunit EIIB [Actinomycetaceae bacterium]|nr:PTS transporter subunit EIIB [Actinomycetaceae bacterium]